MKQKHTLLQCLKTSAIQEKWDAKLSGEFALAPRDMRTQGMARDEYEHHNWIFDEFCSEYVKSVLCRMQNEFSAAELDNSVVTVLGPGLCRGLNFIPMANEMGLRVELYDVSEKAIGLADQALQEMGVWGRNSTFLQEIEGKEDEISSDTKLLVMSQFLQILPPDRKDAVLRMLSGKMLANRCKVVIVHPFDNPGACWGDTTPYSIIDLLMPLMPLAKAVGAVIKVRNPRTVLYFNRHRYTAFTLEYQSDSA